jgi:hypothetical protein
MISPAEWSRWNVSLRFAVAPAWPACGNEVPTVGQFVLRLPERRAEAVRNYLVFQYGTAVSGVRSCKMGHASNPNAIYEQDVMPSMQRKRPW